MQNSKTTLQDLNIFIKDRRVWCNSLELAKKFDRPHKSVLRIIRATILRLLVEDHRFDPKYIYDDKGKDLNINKIATNFEEIRANIFALKHKYSAYFRDSSYTTAGGKKNPRFDMTFEGFQIIALGFSGRKARTNKKKFVDGFTKLLKIIAENEILAQVHNEDMSYLEVKKEAIGVRNKFTDALNEIFLPQRVEENGETSQFLARYITSFTNHVIYKKLGIYQSKGKTPPRDSFDITTRVKIELLEEQISELIYEHRDLHYKKIYRKISDEILGITCQR